MKTAGTDQENDARKVHDVPGGTEEKSAPNRHLYVQLPEEDDDDPVVNYRRVEHGHGNCRCCGPKGS